MFAVYRYHAVVATTHRDHAIIEQAIADLKDSALAHLPSGVFTANAALARVRSDFPQPHPRRGALASAFHARARTSRAQLIHAPGRIARSAYRRTLHLPRRWPWEPGLNERFRHALHDPLPAPA
jgi:hypothetical protein